MREHELHQPLVPRHPDTLDTIVGLVELDDEVFTITRYGKPIAVMLSVDRYEKIKQRITDLRTS